MKYLFLLFFLIPVLSGCNSSNARESNEDDNDPVECLGFSGPSLGIAVIDSQTGQTINTARVDIYYLGDSQSTTEAIFNTETDLFFSDLQEFNGEDIGYVISDANYHTFVAKGIALDVVTSCGAENYFEFTVHLCPLGTSCL